MYSISFYGNINIGKDIDISFLSDLYDVVIISTGSANDRTLSIKGSELNGVFGSSEFVGWYNGNFEHEYLKPNLATNNAVIIGNGNVALDCARVLAKTYDEFYGSDITDYSLIELEKSKVENIFVIGRRTPKDSKFTIAELRELGNLNNYTPTVNCKSNTLENILKDTEIDTKVKKNIELLLSFKNLNNIKKNKIVFDFLLTPYKINGKEKVESITFKKSKIVRGNNKIEIKFGFLISQK